MNNKGQAALEFLMTYGWTILAAIVSIAAFAQFGLVSAGTLTSITGFSVCVLPPGLACEHRIGENGIQLVLTNGFPARIVDVSVRVISSEIGLCVFPDPESNPKAIINVGESKQIFVSCPDMPSNTKRFKGDLEVSYRFEDQSLTHTDTGTIRGSVEEGTICIDFDGDGYGAGGCETAIDCDDGDSAVYPNAPPETNPDNMITTCAVCQDSKDNNCDTFTDGNDAECEDACIGDPTCSIPDGDGDTYDDILCGGNDCDDLDLEIHPPDTFETGLTMCQDLKDNDCDGHIDLIDLSCGGLICQDDFDLDSYISDQCIGGDDCDDDPEVCGSYCYPGFPSGELCEDDGKDNDCNGLDEHQEACSCLPGCDNDGDNSCSEGCMWPGYDCDDGNNKVNIYQPENCATPFDDNCNDQINEYCSPCDPGCDIDQDSYCSDSKECGGNDCNDNNKNINPGVWDEYSILECSDSLDNDCDGDIDCNEECCLGNAPSPPGSSPIFSPLLKPVCAYRCGIG